MAPPVVNLEDHVNIENQHESGAPITDEVSLQSHPNEELSNLPANTTEQSPQVENSTNIASNIAPTPLQPREEPQQI